jgi:hypothetical protein
MYENSPIFSAQNWKCRPKLWSQYEDSPIFLPKMGNVAQNFDRNINPRPPLSSARGADPFEAGAGPNGKPAVRNFIGFRKNGQDDAGAVAVGSHHRQEDGARWVVALPRTYICTFLHTYM